MRARPAIAWRASAAGLAFALAGTLAHVAAPAASAEIRLANAVTWTVDHAARTITATVRLQLGSACTPAQAKRAAAMGPAAANRCKVGPEIAKAVKDNIESIWSADYVYYCYTLKVVADVTTTDAIQGPRAASDAAPDGRVHVSIDQSPAGIRSSVRWVQETGAAWNSRYSRDAPQPTNGDPDGSSIWQYPPSPGDDGLYAHEAGHVMGLNDAYEDVRGADGRLRSRTRADAPSDLMADQAITYLDQATINLLVMRAGIGWTSLECDQTADRAVPGGTQTGTKCHGLMGEWILDIDAETGPRVTQQFNVDIGEVSGTYTGTEMLSGRGTFTYTSHSVYVGPGTKAEGWGESSGYATISVRPDASVLMTLQEAENRTRGKTTAGGQTFSVPWQDAPLVVWTFEWQPTTCKDGG